MKLSLVFELLLIFVLLAFAASKHIGRQKNSKKGIQKQNDYIKIEDNSINKYCKCSEAYCNCCRDLAVPLVNLNGPGCASLMYLNGDKMSVSLSFGKKVITNRTLSGRKPSPVCMPLPGGISKFCGRVYNIARAGEEFRACLGLELQAKSTVEAAVRVSCFKFGPRGVTSEPADPLPLVPQGEKVTEDDDDDDDDDDEDDDAFALDAGDDDDDDDDEEEDDDDGDLDTANDVGSADYTGFSLLGEDLLGGLFGSSGGKNKKTNKNKNKQAPLSSTTTTTTTRRPRPHRRTTKKPTPRVTTQRPLVTRTTTVKVRPVNRRPTRRPVKRTTTKPTDASSAVTEENTVVSTTSTTVTPVITANTDAIISNNNKLAISLSEEMHQSQQVIPITDITTPKPTTFEDAGLEMSLAHITGQLSFMPVTQLIPTTIKESNVKVTKPEVTNYEQIATITSKPHSLIPFATTVDDDNEEMVQIVQSLDSHSDEHVADSDKVADETRSHKNIAELNHYEGLSLPKQKNRGQFNLDDLDVLDLTGIGESVGHQLGIFGRHKRQNKNKVVKPHGGKGSNDYDYLLGLDSLSDSIALPDIDDFSRKDRRRQNKMMRGLWSQA